MEPTIPPGCELICQAYSPEITNWVEGFIKATVADPLGTDEDAVFEIGMALKTGADHECLKSCFESRLYTSLVSKRYKPEEMCLYDKNGNRHPLTLSILIDELGGDDLKSAGAIFDYNNVEAKGGLENILFVAGASVITGAILIYGILSCVAFEFTNNSLLIEQLPESSPPARGLNRADML